MNLKNGIPQKGKFIGSINGIGQIYEGMGLEVITELDHPTRGHLVADKGSSRGSVDMIVRTADRKVYFIADEDHTEAYIPSSRGPAATYPLLPVIIKKPIAAVMMDLDGSSLNSEGFWVWMIE